jgi:mannose-1-phosphate guanylyltransferase/phosphomannomutase
MAVNAVLDEDRTIGSQRERDEALDALRRLVRASGAELGALLDGTGERLFLIDGAARSLDPRTALLAFVSLVMRTARSLRVALPVTTSRVAERIVRARGGEVMWTRISPSALMTAGEEGGAAFGGDEEGGYIFPRFLPSFDALMSLLRLLEMLAHAGTTLEAVVDGLPEAHVVRRDVPTPWESKGVVMRHLMEHIDNGRVETIDGVKAYRGEDWALVVPHPQEPLVRVWAEAGSARAADELAGEFASLVADLRA